MAKKKPGQDLGGGVESALTKTERFFEENQKMIIRVATVVVALVAIYLGFKRFYMIPRENEAHSQMFVAEQYFENDSFNLALYGDGNYSGFLEIIKDYGLTKSANLAKYYSGISFLRLGQYEEALKYLNRFKARDKMVRPVATGAIGDTYVELGEMETGLNYYLRAAKESNNNFTTPLYLIKAGQVYEHLQEFDNALNMYNRVSKEYPEYARNNNIDKYIARLQAKMNE